MAELRLGQDFTDDESVGEPMPVITTDPGVKEELPKEVPVEEIPSASPAEEEPSKEGETLQTDDAGELTDKEREGIAREIQGLKAEKTKLLKDIVSLKGERRQLKQAEAQRIQTEIDELKDLDPTDVLAIERILKAKGYVRQDEVDIRLYEQRKDLAIDKFLEKHPEYKKENDPDDIRWGALEREMEMYRRPDNPDKVYDLLVRAHREISGLQSSDKDTQTQRRRVQVASMGGGGVQRSSSQKSATPPSWMIDQWRQGGWSEEEIQENIKNYQE